MKLNDKEYVFFDDGYGYRQKLLCEYKTDGKQHCYKPLNGGLFNYLCFDDGWYPFGREFHSIEKPTKEEVLKYIVPELVKAEVDEWLK